MLAAMTITPSENAHVTAIVISRLARLFESDRKRILRAVQAYFE